MDIDSWPSRIFPSKHHHLSARYISDNHLLIDDSDGDEDVRAYFPCPFCCIDIEVHVLCSHLQDEHCILLKNALPSSSGSCEVAAGQHDAHGLSALCSKSRERCNWAFHSTACKFIEGIVHFFYIFTLLNETQLCKHCSFSSSKNIFLCPLQCRRDSPKSGSWTGSSATTDKEPSSFLGSSANSRLRIHDAAPDPLLSPFLEGISHSQPQGSEQDESCTRTASVSSEISSLGGSHKLDPEQRMQRAAFVQQLISSTIL